VQITKRAFWARIKPGLAAKIQTLPDTLRRSLTWDQGAEMRD
jgi:IS30 family transposase